MFFGVMKQVILILIAAVLKAIVKLFGRLVYRIRITGAEHIPSQGGALLVGNHTSYMDFILMVCLNRRSVAFIMNEDVFKKPLLRPLLESIHCIPIGPRSRKNDLNAFNQAVADRVNAGYLVAIFAEGTVTRTGQILEFKRGVEHLSKLVNAPIIPIHFDNVAGTPFSYRAGQKRMLRFSWSTLRRKVRIRVGTPIHGGTTAFALRQRIKELEVVSFGERLADMPGLPSRMMMAIHEGQGGWKTPTDQMAFGQMQHQLGALNSALVEPLRHKQVVAMLLPKTAETLSIYVWMVLNRKTIVTIDPRWSNEQRMFAIRRSGAEVLITTGDIGFSHWASTEDEVIYLDDLREAMKQGKPVNIICKNIRRMGRSVAALWSAKKAEAPMACFFDREDKDMSDPVFVYAAQFNAVIASLRQAHHFEKGGAMCAELPLSNAFGLMLQVLLPMVSGMWMHIGDEQADVKAYALWAAGLQGEIVIAGPEQLKALSALAGERNLAGLTHVFTADIHPLDETVQSLNARGIQVLTCAGMNQTASVYALNGLDYHGDDIVGKPLKQECFDDDSIGKPLPGVAVKIVDPNDHSVELAHDQEGLIFVKGPSITPNTVDGWLDTGMRGSLDHRGFIHGV